MNCEIRQWRIQDADDLSQAVNNKNVQNNMRDGMPYPYTKADAAEFINAMLASNKNDTFSFAITVQDKVVGSIGLFRKDNIHSQTAEMGYYIAEPYWGKGIATNAVKLACKHVFDNTDIIRIFAEPFSHNVGSCRVLEKSGFQFEGVLRSNAVKNGQVVDMKMYSLIKGT